MGFMAGKKALIVGVASERSIAAGIAEAFAREGCEIAFTYQNEKLLSRVEKLSARLGPCCFPAMSHQMTRLPPFLKAWARSGMASTSLSIQSASRRVNNSRAALSSPSPGKASPSLMTSRPTASRRLPKPVCR
jgi:enoyl-[acyl-carrier-protein] reductase (NADH)